MACGKPQLAALCDNAKDCGDDDGLVCQPIHLSVQGQCTRACQTDEQCDEAFGEGECVVTCKLSCETGADCPAGTDCFLDICRARCESDTDCVSTAKCSYGLCETVR